MSDIPSGILKYWTRGKGAIKIGYGTPGAFDRGVAAITEATGGRLPPHVVRGMVANLIKRVTGRWPGRRSRR
ncbi:hypothetical protein [Salinispora vitiensis]|uniref:hypothetical protein n=1 Tax=Salinispora vitiensis TaxID=999544 RepID=UPI00036BE2A5|nr:hypothetical protein [Salinispora vitiensis]